MLSAISGCRRIWAKRKMTKRFWMPSLVKSLENSEKGKAPYAEWEDSHFGSFSSKNGWFIKLNWDYFLHLASIKIIPSSSTHLVFPYSRFAHKKKF